MVNFGDVFCSKEYLWIHVSAVVACLVTTVLLATFEQVYKGFGIWLDFQESRDMTNSQYNETIHSEDAFRTRANTWSNMAYLMVGFYCIALAKHDYDCLRTKSTQKESAGYLQNTPAMSLAYGVACVYLGFGSAFFHASLTRIGQRVDVAAMYAPLVTLLALNLGRWYPTVVCHEGRPSWPWFVLLAFLTCALLFHYKWPMDSFYVVPVLSVALAYFVLMDVISRRVTLKRATWLAAAAVLALVGLLCHELDRAGTFSSSDSWWQGHAVWHVLTAGTLWCVYIYYRTEEIPFVAPHDSQDGVLVVKNTIKNDDAATSVDLESPKQTTLDKSGRKASSMAWDHYYRI